MQLVIVNHWSLKKYDEILKKKKLYKKNNNSIFYKCYDVYKYSTKILNDL